MPHTDEGTLHAHLDGELSAAEAAELKAHLATCAACRERLDAARAVRERAHDILRRADPPPVTMPDFATLSARHSEAPAPAPPRSSRALALAWAASVAMALGAGWFAQDLLRGGDRQTVAISSQEARITDAAPEPGSTESARAIMSAPAGAARTTDGGAAGVGEGAPPALGADANDAATDAPAAGAEPTEVAAAAALAKDADADRPPPMAAATLEAAEAAEQPAGVVAAPPPIALRGLPATAAMAAGSGGWPGSDGWVEVEATAAVDRLGRDLLAVPDLPVTAHATAADGSRTVRVTQRLPGGEGLEVLQRVGDGPDEIEIVVRAPVAADSLERLRRAVR